MKVKIPLYYYGKHDKIVEVAAYIRLEGHPVSQYYVVFANPGYRICHLDDSEMEVVDTSLRPEWQGFEDDSGFSPESRRLFPEFTSLFWDHLLDDETYALNLFEKKRRLFAGPNIKASRWLGFEYPMRQIDFAHLNFLFRYSYPTSEVAIRRREELLSLTREIIDDPFSIKGTPSIKQCYAFNLAIQLDEVGVAMFLLAHTPVWACIDEPVAYGGRVYPPPLMQAVSNISVDAVKLLLGYGASTDIDEIFYCTPPEELKSLLKMSPKELYSDDCKNLI